MIRAHLPTQTLSNQLAKDGTRPGKLIGGKHQRLNAAQWRILEAEGDEAFRVHGWVKVTEVGFEPKEGDELKIREPGAVTFTESGAFRTWTHRPPTLQEARDRQTEAARNHIDELITDDQLRGLRDETDYLQQIMISGDAPEAVQVRLRELRSLVAWSKNRIPAATVDRINQDVAGEPLAPFPGLPSGVGLEASAIYLQLLSEES